MDTTASSQPTTQSWRHETPSTLHPLPEVNTKAFAAELDVLHAALKADLGESDLAHLRQQERAGRLISLLGYLLSGTILWPVAAVLLGLGNLSRWIVAHHVLHRGYDQVPGIPDRYRSTQFARGARRWLDWPDWLLPEAWCHEHNLR